MAQGSGLGNYEALNRRRVVTRRVFLRSVLGASGALALASCGGLTASSSSPAGSIVLSGTSASAGSAAAKVSPSSSAVPKTGGTLRYGMVGDLNSLEPHALSVPSYATLWQAFDRLTAYNFQLQPQPQLAESWDLSPDYKQLKLNLRKGVTYHTGREFTSDDVKYNMMRVRDPKLGTGQLANESNWFTSVDTPDKYTVVLRSDQSRPAMFDFFENFNMVDHETMEGPNAKTAVVGTGPFKFVEWVQGDHFTLAKNPNYWQTGLPYLDGFRVWVLRDTAALATQLESGALDVIDSPSLLDFARLKQDPKYQAITHPGNDRVYVVGANVTAPPTDNKLVRQALFYAMNRQRFVDTMLHGVGQAQSLFWNANSPAYEPAKGYTFDLAKAKSLLAQAGATNLSLDITMSPTGNAAGEVTDFAQMYQADLASIGVKLNIKPVDGPTFSSVVPTHKYVGLYTASATTPSEPSTTMIYSAGFNYNGNNSGYKSDAYSKLVNTVSTEPDAAKRKQLYSQLNDLFVDEAFITALGTLTIQIAALANIKGIVPLVHDTFSYTSASIQ